MSLFWQVEPVKVEFHLDNGYTKVVYIRLVGLGMLDGDWFDDIPTTLIPPHLIPNRVLECNSQMREKGH